MIEVLVVDGHSFFRDCLVEALNASTDVAVVGECAAGCEVVAAVGELAPDVVLLDVRMAELAGLHAASAQQRERFGVPLLMLTTEDAQSFRTAARRHGAAGLLVKGGGRGPLLDAIRRVADGGSAWPDDVLTAARC